MGKTILCFWAWHFGLFEGFCVAYQSVHSIFLYCLATVGLNLLVNHKSLCIKHIWIQRLLSRFFRNFPPSLSADRLPRTRRVWVQHRQMLLTHFGYAAWIYLLVKLTFSISTVCSHHFRRANGYSREKGRSFFRQKCLDPEGTRLSNFRIHTACSTIWATGVRHLLSLGIWLFFVCKVNNWNANCARATAFNKSPRTDVL